MVYFQVSKIGFNCGREKGDCKAYPDNCRGCIIKYFANVGIEADQNMKLHEVNSEEKRVQMQQTIIWYEFLDVLNIKHIILITKDSGLPIIDYPVSNEHLNVEILIGFIQANIHFSTSKSTLVTRENGFEIVETGTTHKRARRFYEFQYETFSLLIMNGEKIRVCLVLDKKPSPNLKNRLSEFTHQYESMYKTKIDTLLSTGKLNFDDTINFIIEAFNIKLLFPMVLSHAILPSDLELINKNPIQKAIIDFANELLASKKFFFIPTLFEKIQTILNSDPYLIIYEIYQFLEKNVIIPSNLHEVEKEIREFNVNRARRIADNKLISPIIANDEAINLIKEEARTMNTDEANRLMELCIKKGQTAEKAFIYKEALKEYEKALYLATGFNFELDIGKISFMVLELDKKIKVLELESALEAGEKAEKKKDYVNAIHQFQSAIELMNDTEIFKSNGNASKLKKLQKRIAYLQNQI